MRRMLTRELFALLFAFAIIGLPSQAQAEPEEQEAGPEGRVVIFMKGADGEKHVFRMTPTEFKTGLDKAVADGVVEADAAKQALQFIEDQRVLHEQFFFLKEQQRKMVSSVGSLTL